MKSHDSSLSVALDAVANLRRGTVEVVDANVVRFEYDLTSGGQPRRDQILDDFVLSVNRDRAAARQPAQIDAMAAAGEAQLDAMMGQAEARETLTDAGLFEQVDGALLEQAGADALFDIAAAASLEHDRFDAGKVQQVREHQACGPRADDADLCAEIHFQYAGFSSLFGIKSVSEERDSELLRCAEEANSHHYLRFRRRPTTAGSFVPSKCGFARDRSPNGRAAELKG